MCNESELNHSAEAESTDDDAHQKNCYKRSPVFRTVVENENPVECENNKHTCECQCGYRDMKDRGNPDEKYWYH